MTELMPGSLRSFLGQRGFPFEAPHIVKIAIGVARAMSFLHSMQPPILHRDLKSTHILVRNPHFPRDTHVSFASLPRWT
jgi:serine/threonine protein kinase